MRLKLIKIGNSFGVILPRWSIKEMTVGDEVEIELETRGGTSQGGLGFREEKKSKLQKKLSMEEILKKGSEKKAEEKREKPSGSSRITNDPYAW